MDCGDWDGGVRYTYNDLQAWQKYYNWHDGTTSSWNFNYRNTARGYEEWNNWPASGSTEPNGGTGEPNAQFLTNGLFNDLNPDNVLGYMCRSWSELQASCKRAAASGIISLLRSAWRMVHGMMRPAWYACWHVLLHFWRQQS